MFSQGQKIPGKILDVIEEKSDVGTDGAYFTYKIAYYDTEKKWCEKHINNNSSIYTIDQKVDLFYNPIYKYHVDFYNKSYQLLLQNILMGIFSIFMVIITGFMFTKY